VIKSLGKIYRNVQVVSGATILGNGAVALILDPHRLVQNVIQSMAEGNRSDGRGTRRSRPVNHRQKSQRNAFAQKGNSHGT
jgi:two-component system chemotaxis sensor kinase CheA